MSASSICPQCSGTTFRSPDGGKSYQICECIDLGESDDEAAEQAVFKALHDAIVASGYERAFGQEAFCGQLLLVAQSAVKFCKTEGR